MDPIIDLAQENQEEKADVLSWRALEHRGTKKSKEWFFAVSIVAAGIIIFSLILANVLFGIVILLATTLLFMYEIREPKEYEFVIHQNGIQIHQRLFEYKYLKSFWIVERADGTHELLLQSKKTMVPQLKIPLGTMDPREVRAVLRHSIKEEEQEESLIDVIAERLGF